MTNQHLTPSGEAGIDGRRSPPASTTLSRRTVLQLAGGAASLAAIPEAMAQITSPSTMGDSVPMPVRLTVNRKPQELELDPRQSLLDVLRETLDLTGTKKGCNQGACGACTILVNGKRIVSCLTLASMHDGARIETIEGLDKDGELHPLQAAFVEHEGLQCGFCTPVRSCPDLVASRKVMQGRRKKSSSG